MPNELHYVFPAIPYLKLRFHLISRSDCHLPFFKGSLLRGAFGHALRRTVCIMPPKQLCETCMIRTQCAYPHLFETFIEKDPPRFLRGLNTAPRPYVLEPFDTQQQFKQNETLRFDNILLGQAIDFFPYVIYAVSQMAEGGLGRNRHPFALESVQWQNGPESEDGWQILYDGASQQILETPEPIAVDATPKTEISNSKSQLPKSCRLAFLTPARLKFNNTFRLDFSFRHLVFKMIRRVLETAHFHVPEAQIDWEFHDLLVAADEVHITHRDLHWLDWQRRSNRQQTTMKMGGFTGEITLEGTLAPFLNLLRTCEALHIGKGVVFGNGKIEISEVS